MRTTKIYYGILINGQIPDIDAFLMSVLSHVHYDKVGVLVLKNETIIYLRRISNEPINNGKYKDTLLPSMVENIETKPDVIENAIIRTILGELYKYDAITTVGYHCVK